MRSSQKFTQKDTCTDTLKLTAKSEIDHELRSSLIDPEIGILKPGCMPTVQTANAAGSKMLLDAISKAISFCFGAKLKQKHSSIIDLPFPLNHIPGQSQVQLHCHYLAPNRSKRLQRPKCRTEA